MNNGCLIFAFNNEKIDYIKQAKELAIRIRKHLGLPTSIVTDVQITTDVFDKIIVIDEQFPNIKKTYHNGAFNERLSFKNSARIKAYDLTPYTETIVLDSDMLIANDNLSKCFNQNNSICMYDNSFDICAFRKTLEFTWISDIGCKFYWATCVYFKKDKQSKLFFDLVNHVYENYLYYKRLYQINSNVYRNDFSFSIAAHIMNNYQKGDFIGTMPDTMYYSLDTDNILEIKEDNFLFLTSINNKKMLVKTKNQTVHAMNKYDLEKLL